MSRSFLTATLLLSLSLAPAHAADKPLHDFIDDQVQAAWAREKIKPARLADDAEFLRRVYLDLIGIIPTYEETKAFLEDKAPDKRAKLIDRLLDHPRYAVHQADVWDMVLFTRRPPGYMTYNRPTFQRWLREQFAKNVPYDKWVHDILKGEGSTVDNGPPWFLAQYDRQPEDAAEKITQTFLGVQLQCARCHDHPFEEWKQVDFYGVAAFLARLQVIQMGQKNNELRAMIGEKDTGEVLFTGPASQQTPGKKGEPIKPKFLQGQPLEEPPTSVNAKEERLPSGKAPPKPAFSRKDKLAEWVTARDNPYFARAVANRVWGQFMGRGIVHPIDNMSPKNRPSHPELLQTCAQAMLEHNFDLKWYIRELCNSKTYQLASTGEVEDAKPRWFERARVRPLSAEELLESWRVATGYDQAAVKVPKTGKRGQERFQGVTWDYMVRFFGQPSNGMGNFQGGLQEHLYLNNGEVTRLIATGKGSLYQTVIEDKGPLEDRVDRLYLSILSRPAKPAEKKKFAEHLGADNKGGERLREAIWVLMTCSEFRFNH